MINRLAFVFTLVLLFLPSFLAAQDCSNVQRLSDGTAVSSKMLDRGPGNRIRGYVCYNVYVPEGSQYVATLQNINTVGDWNLAIGRNFNPETLSFDKRLTFEVTAGSGAETFAFPSATRGHYTIVAWPASDQASQACITFHQFNREELFVEAIGLAAAQHFIKWLLLGNSDEPSEAAKQNADRIAAVGLSVLRGRNLGEVGVDALMNEVAVQLASTFGAGSFLFTTGVNYYSGYLENVLAFSFDKTSRCQLLGL